MRQDISRVLQEWAYDGDQVLVRVVAGEDGREKIQLRVDLGILQMEIDGRPDGARPMGQQSWLDFYIATQREQEAANPDAVSFQLNDEDCVRLWREGVQYYHRYLSFWHLGRYDLCARDTARNLRLFEFVRTYAQGDRNKLQFDQWRPYVVMMHARAVATPMIDQGRFSEALRTIDSAIENLREFLEEYDRSDRADQCAELVHLEQWREEVLAHAAEQPGGDPSLRLEVLRRRLQAAVSAEEFEEAARLRDEIRKLQ
ncbi:MAG: UvrB/UvrC motif-containing protein [Thermoguttaceae bacterium]